ncbi:MAG: hypothetical protein JSU65_09705 [Candidatus Zixiibacteriota bacterium]|nr:MAG: hypothetical protein JSU65_09705 [candidate division Zixibacteria bacterium]
MVDTPLDGTDAISYQPPGKVNPMQESEREKQRQSSRALKEKMEDDLTKRKREQMQDEVVLGEDHQSPRDAQTGEDAEGNVDDSPGQKRALPPDDGDVDDTTHVDLKA